MESLEGTEEASTDRDAEVEADADVNAETEIEAEADVEAEAEVEAEADVNAEAEIDPVEREDAEPEADLLKELNERTHRLSPKTLVVDVFLSVVVEEFFGRGNKRDETQFADKG